MEQICMIYSKDGFRTRAIPINTDKNEHKAFITNGYRHTATLNMVVFFESILNDIPIDKMGETINYFR